MKKNILKVVFVLFSLFCFLPKSEAQILTSVSPSSAYCGLVYGNITIQGTGLNLPLSSKVFLIRGSDTLISQYESSGSTQIYASFDFSDAAAGSYTLAFYNHSSQYLSFLSAFQLTTTGLPAAPMLISPTNGQFNTTGQEHFSWGAVTTASVYFLQYSSSSNFSNPVTITSYPTHYNTTQILFNGANYWRVRACTNGWLAGPWSATYVLNVSITPQLLSITPDNAYQGQNLTNIRLSGLNTHFKQGSSTFQLTLDQHSTSLNVTGMKRIADNQTINGHCNVVFSTPTGLYDVNMYNNIDGLLTLYNGFYVHGGNTYSGNVFFDLNSNNVFDTGDYPYYQGVVGVGLETSTCLSNGNFTGYLPVGSYTASVMNLPTYFTSNPPSYSFSFSGTGANHTGLNFALQPTQSVSDMEITMSSNRSRARVGFPLEIYLNYKNLGSVTESGQFYFLPPSSLTIDSVSDPNFMLSGDTMIWNYSNFPPMQSTNIIVYFSVPSNLTIGSVVNYEAGVRTSGADIDLSNNVKYLQQTVTASYDPNQKSVTPENLSPAQIPLGQYLDYTIHFQNTGNDTAQTVRILDTLDTNVDLNTFAVTASDHNWRVIIYQNRVIEFRFDNINLPDSGTNEVASHGFISYHVKVLPTVTVADHILNTAYIYFDLNAPIVTNTCITTVGVGVNELSENNSGIIVSPNPFNEKTEITYSLSEKSEVSLRVLNYQGQLIRLICNGSQDPGKHSYTFDAAELPAGIYFVSLQDGGRLRVKKMVVVK